MQNLGNMQFFFFKYICAQHTVLTDLLLLFMCHRHVNNCIQLSTLRGATISNTVLCTLPIFSVVKSNLFIRALLPVTIVFLLRKKIHVYLAYILLIIHYILAICCLCLVTDFIINYIIICKLNAMFSCAV